MRSVREVAGGAAAGCQRREALTVWALAVVTADPSSAIYKRAAETRQRYPRWGFSLTDERCRRRSAAETQRIETVYKCESVERRRRMPTNIADPSVAFRSGNRSYLLEVITHFYRSPIEESVDRRIIITFGLVERIRRRKVACHAETTLHEARFGRISRCDRYALSRRPPAATFHLVEERLSVPFVGFGG